MKEKHWIGFTLTAFLLLGTLPVQASEKGSKSFRAFKASEKGTNSFRSIKDCTTITEPGSYEVVRNIQATEEGVCLVVNADHVAIDIVGFEISGTGGFEGGTAIGGSAAQDVKIQNGTITNFYVGISLRDTENVTVTDMTFVENSNAAAYLGPGASVRNSFFTRSAGEAWALEVGRGSIVKDCIFSQNNIAASIGPSSLVINNVVKDSNEDSMNIGEKSVVIGNTVVDTFDEGLRVGALSTVVNNNAHGNDGIGDLLVTCPSNVVGNFAGHLAVSNPAECNFSDNLFLSTD